jgi:hypothetical protein
MTNCHRCGGLVIKEWFTDERGGAHAIDGWRCVICGACGDLPHAQWKQPGVTAPRVQKGPT